MYRVVCQLKHAEMGAREVLEYEKIPGRADISIDKYEVAIKVQNCLFTRKTPSRIVKELLKEHHEDKAEGVGTVGIGVITQVGQGVNDMKIGTTVVFIIPETSKHSGLAHTCIVPRYFCFECNSSLDKTDIIVMVDSLIPTFYALQNKVNRGDTVLICDSYTTYGQLILQILHQKGCKIVVYLAQEFEKDMLTPYRHMIDGFIEAWIYRSNLNQLHDSLIAESDRLGYSLVLCLQMANPWFTNSANDSDALHKNTLSLSSAITVLSSGGHLVLANDKQTLTRTMCQHLFAKACSFHYINITANLCSPSKLGSLLNYIMSQLELLESKKLILPQPIHKVSLEHAVQILNNELDDMKGSYVTEF